MAERVSDERTGPDTGPADYVALAVRGALGAVPFAGSLLAELAGSAIPNQRIERIAKFAGALDRRLAKLECSFVRSQIVSEEFTDLVEEGLRQAARSLSDGRREYIASVIAGSLSPSDIEYQDSRHLLRLLGEVSDIEVIWLRFHMVPTLGGDEDFRNRHSAVLAPAVSTMGSPQKEHDRAALQHSYKQHLAQLGLLQPRYHVQRHTQQPEYDSRTGAAEIAGYELSSLGRLLLREIGLADEQE